MVDRNSPDRSNAAYLAADGTDLLTYNNVSSRTGPSGKLQGAFHNVVNITSQAKIPADADALTMLTNEVISTIRGDRREAPTDPLSRIDFRRKAEPEFTSAPKLRDSDN